MLMCRINTFLQHDTYQGHLYNLKYDRYKYSVYNYIQKQGTSLAEYRYKTKKIVKALRFRTIDNKNLPVW